MTNRFWPGVGVVMLSAGAALLWYLAEGKPVDASVAPLPTPAPVRQLPMAAAVAATVAASAAAAAPTPRMVVPPAMARIAHEARDTPIDRPMNRVSKNWLGCADKADYLTTMELLNQHDPAVAGRFQGASPACEMLTEGTPVTLAFVDAEAHLAQVRVSASGRLLWTDPSALDGG